MPEYEEQTGNSLHISKNDFPDGMVLQWVTTHVYGQPVDPKHLQSFTRRGFEPVCRGDFDGRYDSLLPGGTEGQPISPGGMMLMARPKTWHEKAQTEDRKRAIGKIRSVEEKHRGGLIGGNAPSLLAEGVMHPGARNVSGIKRSVEPLDIGPLPERSA
jgi:hypothetical protein